MINYSVAPKSKHFKWYAVKVDVVRISIVKNNIMRINTKYIKEVYDINDMLKKHNIRKGILFIRAYMCSAIQRVITQLDHIYGFIPSKTPCPIHDLDAFIDSIKASAKSQHDIVVDTAKVDSTIAKNASETESIEDISVYQPGAKIIVTFGIFKDCIGYIQSVDYETKNITVKVLLNDSDLEMITDINMFYAKVM